MPRTRTTRSLAALALTTLVLVGCGGDGDDQAEDAPTTEAAGDEGGTEDGRGGDDGGDAGTDTGAAEAIGGEDAADALDAVGLETKGEALVSATNAERFEVTDGVLHLYLGSDAGVPEGTECIIVGSVLTGDEEAIVHRADGSEVTC